MQNYEPAIDAIADPTRRRILDLLCNGPRTVGSLARELPVSQPAVSQHLKLLLQAGLVRVTARGTSREYAVEPAGLIPLRAYVESFWDDALRAFRNEAARVAANKLRKERKERRS